MKRPLCVVCFRLVSRTHECAHTSEFWVGSVIEDRAARGITPRVTISEDLISCPKRETRSIMLLEIIRRMHTFVQSRSVPRPNHIFCRQDHIPHRGNMYKTNECVGESDYPVVPLISDWTVSIEKMKSPYATSSNWPWVTERTHLVLTVSFTRRPKRSDLAFLSHSALQNAISFSLMQTLISGKWPPDVLMINMFILTTTLLKIMAFWGGWLGSCQLHFLL